jgi:hypothetical protein
MPIAIHTHAASVPASLKAKPAVADDYMYDFDHSVTLPTVNRLEASFEADVNPTRIATDFLDQLARATSQDGARDNKLSDLFLEDGEWMRDLHQAHRGSHYLLLVCFQVFGVTRLSSRGNTEHSTAKTTFNRLPMT